MFESLFIFFGVLLCLVIYFVPSLVAYGRHHHQRLAILVLNLVLGATGLAWVIALIWACTAVKRQTE